MAEKVIKNTGAREPFDASKIRNSITAAAKETELPEARQKEIVEQISARVIQTAESKKEIKTSEIRKNILNQLDSTEPSVSAAWRRYDQEKTKEKS